MSAVTNDPVVVQRYIHRASIHSDGGPKAALNVTNTAASASVCTCAISHRALTSKSPVGFGPSRYVAPARSR